jgi:galactokinase
VSDREGRDHCADSLDRGFTVEWLATNESAYPLVIRKKQAACEIAQTDWKERRSEAKKAVEAIGAEGDLREVLRERYDTLIGDLLAK